MGFGQIWMQTEMSFAWIHSTRIMDYLNSHAFLGQWIPAEHLTPRSCLGCLVQVFLQM